MIFVIPFSSVLPVFDLDSPIFIEKSALAMVELELPSHKFNILGHFLKLHSMMQSVCSFKLLITSIEVAYISMHVWNEIAGCLAENAVFLGGELVVRISKSFVKFVKE